jgi:uncharacterized ion transporter superfamily protein YfcC
LLPRLRVPHSLVLLYGIVLFAYVLTWVLPPGLFETVTNEAGRDIVVPGTFTRVEEVERLPVWSVLTVIPRGLAAAQGIIFFVFIIGGALAVVRETGAIDAGLGRLLTRLGHRPGLLIFIGILAFATGASTFGMAEEAIPLTAILVALCAGMRMDAVTATAIIMVGGGVGYGAAAINPFTVVIAQEVAGLQILSGWQFRLAIFVPFVMLGFLHVRRYALKVRADPAASLVADIDGAQSSPIEAPPDVTGRHWTVIALTLATFTALVWGVSSLGWFLTELGAIFVALTIAVGLVARQSFSKTAMIFVNGAAELTGTALLIGVARSVELMLSDAQVLHTIVNGLATPLTYVGGELSAIGMLLVQSVLNFFIPSGSGQAYVTMPIMAPIADIVGVTRQVAVLAFQLGDGLMNVVIPTSAVLMGILGIAGVPYGRWLRFIWPLVLQFVVAGAVAVVIAVLVGYR